MFGLLRRGIVLGGAGLVASYGIAQMPSSIGQESAGGAICEAPSKYISMASKLGKNGFKLSESDREELDKTLLYLFQSKIFESPYHSLYLCYPQVSTAFAHNVGFGNMGSLVFDNTMFYLTCIGFMISLNNMNHMFIAS